MKRRSAGSPYFPDHGEHVGPRQGLVGRGGTYPSPCELWDNGPISEDARRPALGGDFPIRSVSGENRRRGGRAGERFRAGLCSRKLQQVPLPSALGRRGAAKYFC
jgi:hypothetical protein